MTLARNCDSAQADVPAVPDDEASDAGAEVEAGAAALDDTTELLALELAGVAGTDDALGPPPELEQAATETAASATVTRTGT